MGRTNSTTSLIDERAIVATIITRMKRWNNIVTTMPTFNAYSGEVCCCICNGTPVTDAFALVNKNKKPPANKIRRKDQQEEEPDNDNNDNISFITFICGKHARDPEIYDITHTITEYLGGYWNLEKKLR